MKHRWISKFLILSESSALNKDETAIVHACFTDDDNDGLYI